MSDSVGIVGIAFTIHRGYKNKFVCKMDPNFVLKLLDYVEFNLPLNLKKES